MSDRSVSELFTRHAASRLSHDYRPKVLRCLELLPEAALWARPNEATNSPGNIVSHLAGNLRQWVISGLGGEPDRRRRDVEFATRDGAGAAELSALIERTIGEAVQVIRGLDDEDLRSLRKIQVYRVTGLGAVLHAVEHFSGHTGQLVWITKSILGRPLDFYRL